MNIFSYINFISYISATSTLVHILTQSLIAEVAHLPHPLNKSIIDFGHIICDYMLSEPEPVRPQRRLSLWHFY